MPTCSRSSNGSPRLLNRRAKCRRGAGAPRRGSRAAARAGGRPSPRVASSANRARSARHGGGCPRWAAGRRLASGAVLGATTVGLGFRILRGSLLGTSTGGSTRRRPPPRIVGSRAGPQDGCRERRASCRVTGPPRGSDLPPRCPVGRWPGRYLSMAMTATGAALPSPAGTSACVDGGRRRRRPGWPAPPSRSRRGGRRCPWAVGTHASMCRPARVVSKITVSGASPAAIVAQRRAGLVDREPQVLDRVEVVVHAHGQVTGHGADGGQLGGRRGHPQLQPLRTPPCPGRGALENRPSVVRSSRSRALVVVAPRSTRPAGPVGFSRGSGIMIRQTANRSALPRADPVSKRGGFRPRTHGRAVCTRLPVPGSLVLAGPR